MKQTNRFWKFIFWTLAATLLLVSGILFFLWQDLNDQQVHAVISITNDHSEYLFFLFFSLLIIGYTVLEIIYSTYIKPLKKISAEASMIYSSNPSHRLNIEGNKDVKNLSLVINDFADIFENLNKNITQQILVARKETEKERNLLAAIMAELPQGVFICNKNGRILLFNSLAKKIFTQKTSVNRTEYFVGLGRSIFHLIDKALIAHSLDEIEERLNNGKQSVASSFITPIHTDHLISVETIPVLDQEKKMTGFILTFQDVTDDINHYDIMNRQLNTLKADLIRHVMLAKNLLAQSPGENPAYQIKKDQLINVLDRLPVQYEQVADVALDALLTRVPLTSLFSKKFLYSLKTRAETLHNIHLNIVNQNKKNKILADLYSLTAAFIFLFENLSIHTQKNKFNIFCHKNDDRVILEITWPSPPINTDLVKDLLDQRVDTLPSLFYILKQNKALFEIPAAPHDTCSQINLILQAEPKTPFRKKQQAPVIAGSRPEFYDFDLFRTDDENIDLLDTSLKNITYTVFDTETTGLNPDGGDEIISIAAVRIVNKRIVYQDIFEELVDPRRDIPMESYKIHGINYEMVSGKKDINHILPVFKKFTSNTVLVGHNIAFDMKMLKVKEKTTHIRFSNPVLDTLLLSAILHPIHEQHALENIANRLGVNIIGRHTALGDTIATAEIFLKLLPILHSNGILTLKDAIKASQRTYYARLKY